MLVPSIFNDFTENIFDDMFPFGWKASGSNSLMNADVKEFDQGYEVDLELPGYQKEDVKAELKDGYLTIEAEHNENKDEKNKEGKYIRRERYSGHCRRSFFIGEEVTQEDIHAQFENGILKLTIPKVEKKPQIEESKYIEIE